MEALARLHSTVVAAYRVNPNITFEVFIHKVDGLSEDYKIGKSGTNQSMSLLWTRNIDLEVLSCSMHQIPKETFSKRQRMSWQTQDSRMCNWRST